MIVAAARPSIANPFRVHVAFLQHLLRKSFKDHFSAMVRIHSWELGEWGSFLLLFFGVMFLARARPSRMRGCWAMRTNFSLIGCDVSCAFSI